MLPPIYELGFSTVMYGLLLYILFQGMRQFYYMRFKMLKTKASLVWLGAFGVVLGILAFLNAYRDAMDMVAEAGDISPGLVAAAISEAFTYPILGFFILGVAFLFKHINQ